MRNFENIFLPRRGNDQPLNKKLAKEVLTWVEPVQLYLGTQGETGLEAR